ncbi:hypothetical protein J3R83DRAFT_899 [Lanmaoa asiatica]|nr:hypothetical protein J3R83DRAFT_899 [Lanmaoa asiatica]
MSSSATIGGTVSRCTKARFLTPSLRQESLFLPPDAMVNKRKRDELSDSDSDEITPGRQTLPVANLPYDFDQEPQDGMQYLFLVRYYLDFTVVSTCVH